jgi:tetratricopeptide (TPR) repeat protein
MSRKRKKRTEPVGGETLRGSQPPRTRLLLFSAGIGALLVLSLMAWRFTQSAEKPTAPGQVSSSSVPVPITKPEFQDFVGSVACAKCHQKEYDLWSASTHGRAGGSPASTKVIAHFDGQPLRFRDATVTPTTNANGECLFVLESPGVPKLEITADAVVGGGHMFGGGTQSFFHKFSDGTVRFLPFDFSRQKNAWFVQMRRDMTWVPVSSDLSLETDLANWPPHRVLGTLSEFSNCQNCHGSQITARYDPNAHKYDTRYETLRINCESCHGPAKRHLEIVSRPGFDRLQDIGMRPLATVKKDESLMVCFQCHATKDFLQEAPYLPGESLEAFFSIKFPQFQDTYTPDGRIQSFGYQGNHLYSDCYRNGSMTCVDCHDPHSQQYRDVFGKPLAGKFDNRQCTSCHASKALSPELHSHHKADSAGNLCTSCHMPYLQHRGVGTHIHFARSDHSIPIPRPAFDQKLGFENACQKCHGEKDIAWQEGKVREWYGELKPHPQMVSNLFQAANTSDPGRAAELLLASATNHAMAQASGMMEYIKRFLHPDMEPPQRAVLDHLQLLSRSEDPDLRALALTILHLGFHAVPEVRAICEENLHVLPAGDPVRRRWGVATAYKADALAGQGDAQTAIATYQQSLEIDSGNVVTLSHLALAWAKAGNAERAVETLKKALSIQPYRAVLHFQLASIYQRQQQIPEAIREVQEGLQYAPDNPAAHQMLEQLQR